MIRQVALLTVMMKEIKEDKAKSEGGEEVKEKGMIAAEGTSEALLDGAGAGEMESEEEEMKTEEKSITTPHDGDLPQKTLEEARNKPPEKDEEVIEQKGGPDNALFYLQVEQMHVSDEKVIEFTTAMVKEKKMAERKPPRITNPIGGCCYTERSKPEQKEDWSRSNAARAIYWAPLDPWPEPLKEKKPLHSRLRPKENRKILAIYKNHKKKRVTLIVIYLKR